MLEAMIAKVLQSGGDMRMPVQFLLLLFETMIREEVFQLEALEDGLSAIETQLLEEIPEGKVSLENEMIPRWLKENRKLGGFVHDGYFIDIGIPEAYYQFIEDVQKGVVVW